MIYDYAPAGLKISNRNLFTPAPFRAPNLSRLGQLPSINAYVPTAEVELRQGSKVKKVKAIIDSGMQGTHLLITQEIADELGIVPTGKEIQGTIKGQREVMIGKIDLIALPGMKTCALANAKVTIGGDMVALGHEFLAATGAAIVYGDLPGITCSGKPSPAVGVFPQFRFDVTHKNRTVTLTAILDTGFSGDLCLPSEIAAKLGLEKKSTQEVTTPQGKMDVSISTVDRVSFSGHPLCAVENAQTDIMPEQTAINAVLVGEGFLMKLPKRGEIKSAVGYDKDGAFALCAADKSKIRAAKTVYLTIISPEQPTLIAPETSSVPWVPIAVLTAVGGLAIWYSLRKSL